MDPPLPETEPQKHLKMDGWNTIVSFRGETGKSSEPGYGTSLPGGYRFSVYT